MKIKFKHAAILAAVALFTITSCNKNGTVAPEGEAGNLVVTFCIPETGDSDSATKAPPYTASTAKPTTSWLNNIKSMTLLLVNRSDGKVIEARSITLPTTNDLAQQTRTFSNLIAGTYDIYIVANHSQPGSAATWTAASAVGATISTLIMRLQTTPTATWTDKDPTNETATIAYNPAAEVFIAVLGAYNLQANQTNIITAPFVLKRVVSMFRVRLDPNTTANQTVNFNDAGASLRIRRPHISATLASPAATPANISYGPATVLGTDMVYSKGFSNTAPSAATYTNGATLIGTNGITHWKDVMIYPGGTTSSAPADLPKMFDLVVSGLAPVGYVPGGTTTALTTPTLVYWSGVVERGEITANNILEINITLNTNGVPYVPPVSQRGNLDIKIDLLNWDNIVPISMIL